MPYMSGFVNYDTHTEARSAAEKSSAWIVLNEMNDGTATITFLQKNPIQHGQAEHRGNPNDIEYNKPDGGAWATTERGRNKPENCPLCGGGLERGKQRYCPSCGTFEPR